MTTYPAIPFKYRGNQARRHISNIIRIVTQRHRRYTEAPPQNRWWAKRRATKRSIRASTTSRTSSRWSHHGRRDWQPWPSPAKRLNAGNLSNLPIVAAMRRRAGILRRLSQLYKVEDARIQSGRFRSSGDIDNAGRSERTLRQVSSAWTTHPQRTQHQRRPAPEPVSAPAAEGTTWVQQM